LGLVAGYKAGVMVANMITTSMFFLQNANIEKRRPKVLVIGVGVAGISAANTCRKLGADVIGVDIDSERKNSLERIGAKFIENNSNKDMEDTKLKSKSIDKLISEVDAVICAASYSNRLIPRVLSNEHVKKMKNGAVVIDLAARNGGNYELSTLSERHFENGVSIVSIKNIYKGLPETTSNLISNNYAAFCEMLFSDNIDSIKVADQCDIMTVNGVSNKVYTSTN
jgi:NAD(P) transhydrogenase subunit alpha